MKDFYQLFIKELKEIYDAEKHFVKILPEMILATQSSKLKAAFTQHLHETKQHIERLEMIQQELREDFSGAESEITLALIKEMHRVMKATFTNEVKDAALILAAQKIEHFEIAVYGTLKEFASQLKLDKIEKILDETLDEEEATDKKLTKIAEGKFFSSGINKKAYKREAA